MGAPEHVKESPNPPNPSCCRSRGGMRGWPVHRPTHAPATAPSPTAKESPKPKPPRAVSPEAACVSDHSRGQALAPASSQSNRKRIPQSPLTPRAAAPAAACVAGRSRGQHMPPQQALKTNGNSAPHKTAKTKSALVLVASLQRRDGAEWAPQRPPRAAD